jgi:hypothetical protein
MAFRFARMTVADLDDRVKKEMQEFNSTEYARIFRTITPLNANTVEVIDYTGRIWTVERHTMFFFAPAVMRKDGNYVNTSALAWLPSMSAAKWLEKIIEVN